MFYIDFKQQTNLQFGFMVTRRPSVPAPELRGEYVQVAGRDGSLLVTDNTYENISIPVDLNYVSRPDKQLTSFRRLKSWIRGSGPLRFSDDPDVFYKVKACGISGNSRDHIVGSRCVADFICDPFSYFDSGLVPISPGNIYNPYDKAHPRYIITGSGDCTLTVNGKTIDVYDIDGKLIIDSDLFLAFKEDLTAQNNNVDGEYEDLFLEEGMNEVSIAGASLSIIPNWRQL